MSEGKRPGGLTALAVLNFVFGGIGAIALLAIWALIAAADHVSEGQVTNEVSGLLYVILLIGVVNVGLMIASGIGYLGQKRVLGRTFGTIYGVLSLLNTVLSLVAGQPFGIGTIIGLVYPILTLILVNVTFKDDLVN